MDTTRDRTDPAAEESYWREAYRDQPYVPAEASYDDFGPAYAYGVDAVGRHGKRDWNDVEHDLSRDWDSAKGHSTLTWEHAKAAVRDAWNRLTD